LIVNERRRGIIHMVSLVSLAFATIITLRGVSGGSDATLIVFSNTFIRDSMADLLKVFSYVTLAAVFFYARHYLREFGLFRSEFYALCLFALLGVMVLISAASLVTLYLGLELLSLSSYALVAMDRSSGRGSEAAMKYFVLGSMASGLLLYGMSMIYGATGSLELAAISASVPGDHPVLLSIGLAFIVAAMAFKLGAVPFHMWVPDVYEGAPAAMTLFIGSVPKLAAFALLIRLLEGGLSDLHGSWQGMLVMLAVLSIGLGNLVAIMQTNIKRMLAYSTISHMGFVLLGVMSGEAQGYAAGMFYVIVYALMAAGAFGVVILLSARGVEAEQLEDFRGLNQRSPWFAGIMAMFMFSMAGVPPFVGFFAKFQVIQAAISSGFIWLAIFAVVFSVIGAFYYLRVVKLMYFDEAKNEDVISVPLDFRAALSVNGLLQIGLGFSAGSLIAACLASFGAG
jgi:NADH-quinone oxidoreductase subunit N